MLFFYDVNVHHHQQNDLNFGHFIAVFRTRPRSQSSGQKYCEKAGQKSANYQTPLRYTDIPFIRPKLLKTLSALVQVF